MNECYKKNKTFRGAISDSTFGRVVDDVPISAVVGCSVPHLEETTHVSKSIKHTVDYFLFSDGDILFTDGSCFISIYINKKIYEN